MAHVENSFNDVTFDKFHAFRENTDKQNQICWLLRKPFFSRSSKSAFSRHDNVRASSTLLIWLNENVLFFRSALQLSIFVAYNEERVMLGRSNKA